MAKRFSKQQERSLFRELEEFVRMAQTSRSREISPFVADLKDRLLKHLGRETTNRAAAGK
ncbi:MAG: hypothetical protein J7639_07225 [Paenibacillaceae bacterium]|nr:hypothetical protein [Paenibacillaceae bacterium]